MSSAQLTFCIGFGLDVRRCHRVAIRSATLMTVAAITLACSDFDSGPTTGPELSRDTVASARVDVLAHAVARALSDAGLRQQLLEDFRDSPFPRHSLHLPDYLRGTRGSTLAAAASAASGMTVAELIALAETRGGLEIVMPRPMDRTDWRGTADVVVKATDRTLPERSRRDPTEGGYTVNGDRIAFDSWAKPDFPLVVIRPPDHAFGPDPESTRLAAPKASGSTISTHAMEIKLLTAKSPSSRAGIDLMIDEDCDPRTAKVECPDDPIYSPNGLKTPSQYTHAQCTAPTPEEPDTDGDGLRDKCEYEVAATLAPYLGTSRSGDCDLGRETYFIAEKRPSWEGPVLRIFYALSYYFDCGYDHGNWGSHSGDSEFIWLDARYNNSNRWEVAQAFLSAHWHSEHDYSGQYAGHDLGYYGTWLGTFVSWVAEDKHANYRSRSVCDAGAYYLDGCDENDVNQRVEILASGNLGQRTRPLLDRVASRTGFDVRRGVVLSGYEYYWSDVPFRGWDAGTSTSGTAYTRMTSWFGIGGSLPPPPPPPPDTTGDNPPPPGDGCDGAKICPEPQSAPENLLQSLTQPREVTSAAGPGSLRRQGW